MKNTTRLPLGRDSKPLRSALVSWLSLLLAPAWLACGSEANLPVENLGNTSDVRAKPVQQSGTVTAAVGKARLSGHWTGLTKEPYMEVDGEPSNYIFPSGSRKVTLDLEFDEDSFISGSLVFGAGTPPPPQAGVAYPPGLEYGLSVGEHLPPIEGFSHVLSELDGYFATGANESAWLTFQEFAAFSGWCPLQPSLPVGSNSGFSCLGGDGPGGQLTNEGYVCERILENGTREPVDCNMAALCSNGVPCVCNAARCAQSNSEGRITIELDGEELELGFVNTFVLVPERGPRELGPVTLSRAINP
jgi:hypothetical protein